MKEVSNSGEQSHPEDRTTVLIRRFQNGDSRALGELLTLHLPAIERDVRIQLYGIVARYNDPSDIVNEVMVRLLRMKELRFTCGGEFCSLVARLVASTLYSQAAHNLAAKRNRGRSQTWSTEGLANDRLAHAQSSSPASKAAKRELSEIVKVAIGMLDIETQRLFTMHIYEDLSWDEIGAELGMTPDAARMRYKRAAKEATSLTVKIRSGRIQQALDCSNLRRREEDREDDKRRPEREPDSGGEPRYAHRASPPRG